MEWVLHRLEVVFEDPLVESLYSHYFNAQHAVSDLGVVLVQLALTIINMILCWKGYSQFPLYSVRQFCYFALAVCLMAAAIAHQHSRPTYLQRRETILVIFHILLAALVIPNNAGGQEEVPYWQYVLFGSGLVPNMFLMMMFQVWFKYTMVMHVSNMLVYMYLQDNEICMGMMSTTRGEQMTGTLGAGACKLLEVVLVVLTGPYADLTACKKDIYCSCRLFLMVVKFFGSHVPALIFSFMTERKLRRRFLTVNPHLVDRVNVAYDTSEDIMDDDDDGVDRDDVGGVKCDVKSDQDDDNDDECENDKKRKKY